MIDLRRLDCILYLKMELPFSFDGQNTNSKTKNVTENYNAINWTPMKSEELLDFYDEAPLEMQCQSGGGNAYIFHSSKIRGLCLMK